MTRALLLLLLVLATPAWALEKVVLQLKWKHQFQFAGYYAAIEKGFYRDAGLEVELREAAADLDVVDEVLQGRAQFGTGSAELAVQRANGKPVVALAVILQHSPQVLLVRSGAARVIQQLAGKRLMMEQGATELYAYLKKEGLARGSYRVLPHSFGPEELMAGRVDAMSAYSTDEPFLLRQAGFAYWIFSPRSAGIDFYGDNLFTSADLIKKQPALAAAFREASLKGWRYAMQNPDEVAELIRAKYSRRHSLEHLLFEAAEMEDLMQPVLVEIGHQDPGRWRHVIDVHASLGLVSRNASIDGLIYDPRPPQVPFWAASGLVVGVLALVLIASVAWRFAYFNRALNAEILARKEAEAIARASAENFRRLMDVAPVPVIVTGQDDDRILYLNDHARHAFGLPGPAQAFIGKSAPDYYRNPEQRRQLVAELHQHGLVTDRTIGFTNPRGDDIDALVSARIIDFEGQPAIYSVAIDITERNRAEVALRASETRLRTQLEEIAKLQAALKEQAIRDALTGLFNRRYLDETLDRELAWARREKRNLSLVMLDIDHFKRLNDTLGHRAGDEALRAVAAKLREHLRAEDLPCRYGGEEFLILMPHMPLAVAAERAEEWRRAIADMTLNVDGDQVRVTVSMGVATYPEHGGTREEITRNVDRALYAAKREGRNRVVVFTPELA